MKRSDGRQIARQISIRDTLGDKLLKTAIQPPFRLNASDRPRAYNAKLWRAGMGLGRRIQFIPAGEASRTFPLASRCRRTSRGGIETLHVTCLCVETGKHGIRDVSPNRRWVIVGNSPSSAHIEFGHEIGQIAEAAFYAVKCADNARARRFHR